MRPIAGPAWLTARPIAHRGLHESGAGTIENSLSAAAAAIAAHYAVEIDLQPAADGTPVVFHDDTLERLTSARGPVAARTARELGQIRLSGSGDAIPTLEELLDLVAGRTALFIEIKSDRTPRMAPFCASIAEILSTYAGPVAVMSFDPGCLAAFRVAAPDVPCGIVSQSRRSRRPPDPFHTRNLSMRRLLHTPSAPPHFIAYRVDDLPAIAPLLLRAARGLPLLCWTVRTDKQRRRAQRWADQMIFEGFHPE